MNNGGITRMTEKSTNELVEEFLARLNSDVAFRNQFLDDPVVTLRDFGFSMRPDDERKIEEIVSYLKDDIKHIFEIPSGSKNTLAAMGFKILMPPGIDVDTGPERIIAP